MKSGSGPWMLGIAGLIPFVGSSCCNQYNLKHKNSSSVQDTFSSIDWIKVQKSYGCSILSFMGAVHWGLAMVNHGNLSRTGNFFRYSLSTVPCLMGFFSLLSESSFITLSTQLTGFNALLMADFLASRRALLPKWYFPMRLFLTSVVSLSLGHSLYLLPSEKR